MRPKFLDESITIEHIALVYETAHSQKISVDRMLLFWPHHFESFEHGYDNGYKKQGTLRYKKDHIRVPFGMQLPVFESQEFKEGKLPRGIATIEYVVACPLNAITEEELLMDGFENKEDLLWQMTEMEGRYYADLTPDSMVSYYKFKDYNPRPSKKELIKVLEATQPPWEPKNP